MNQKCKFLIGILWNLDIFYIFIINLAKISKKDYIFDYAKLLGIMELIKKGQESIIKMLMDRIEKLKYSKDYLDKLDLDNLKKNILFIYIQNYIFSDFPLEDRQLAEIIKVSMPTLKKNIEQLIKQEYLTELSKRPITHIISNKLQEVLD